MVKKLERKFKYFVIKLLRIRDKAHSVALGFALGLIINFIPSFGFGPVVSVAIARLFRGNSVAGLLGGVSLIWAFPFLFYLNFQTGHWIDPIEVAEVIDQADDTGNPLLVGLHLGRAFFIGMLVNVLIFGLVVYFSIYILIVKYRKRMLQYIYRTWLPQK